MSFDVLGPGNGALKVGEAGKNIQTNISIAVWAKIDIFNCRSEGTRCYVLNRKFQWAIAAPYGDQGSEGFSAMLTIGGTNYKINSTTTNLDEWYHLVLTYDSDTYKFFVNGVMVGSRDLNSPIVPVTEGNGSVTVLGGNIDGDSTFDGHMDGVAIWDVTLTDAQIETLYNNGNGTYPGDMKTSDLAYFAPMEFNDGYADVSGNGYNGSATGTILQSSDVVGSWDSSSLSTNENTDAQIDLSNYVTEIDSGDNLTYSIVTQPDNGTVSISGSTATYSPDSNYNGTDSFVWKVNDGTVDSSSNSKIVVTVVE